jgi:hypothetical protein
MFFCKDTISRELWSGCGVKKAGSKEYMNDNFYVLIRNTEILNPKLQ